VETYEDTRLRILDAAVAMIEAGGETSVRLREVAAAAGLAEPSLYHYFPNREALVVAAHAHRFRVNLTVTVDPFIEAMSGCTSREHFEELVLLVYDRSFAQGRDEVRATRAEIIGHAARRPALREEVTSAMRTALEPTIEILERAQANGWMRPDISARAFAYWNLANITGLIFTELQGDDELSDGFQRLMLEAVSGIVANWSDEPT
jgi:AcrR family transcriptional regulator